jgi:hypothetical protein
MQSPKRHYLTKIPYQKIRLQPIIIIWRGRYLALGMKLLLTVAVNQPDFSF